MVSFLPYLCSSAPHTRCASGQPPGHLMPWSHMLLAATLTPNRLLDEPVHAVACDHSHTVRVLRYHAAALLAAACRACVAPERLAAARSRLPSQTDTVRFCAAPLCSCWVCLCMTIQFATTDQLNSCLFATAMKRLYAANLHRCKRAPTKHVTVFSKLQNSLICENCSI